MLHLQVPYFSLQTSATFGCNMTMVSVSNSNEVTPEAEHWTDLCLFISFPFIMNGFDYNEYIPWIVIGFQNLYISAVKIFPFHTKILDT